MKQIKDTKTAGIGGEAVRAKTGKTWRQWLAILDQAGAGKMNHTEIVGFLEKRRPEMDGWWMQMVTVGYEQARGLREKHQKPTGYEVGGSKTVGVPVAVLFQAWQDRTIRRRWLPDASITIRKATPSKSMRITWTDGTSSLSVNFYPKGGGKSQVVLQHGKLANAKEAARWKGYWAKTLGRLKEILED